MMTSEASPCTYAALPRRAGADCYRPNDRSQAMPSRRSAGFLVVIVCIARCRAGGGQLDCMAVRRIEVGAAPVLLASPLVVWVGNAECGDDPLKRREELPMIGSIRILAGLLRSGGDLPAEHPHPLVPFKPALPVQQHDHGECLRLPRLAECRRAGIAQGTHCRGLAQRPLHSEREVEVVIPEVEAERIPLGRLTAPQLPCGEAHTVDVLRLGTLVVRRGVGEDKHAMVALDDPAFGARVARQAGV